MSEETAKKYSATSIEKGPYRIEAAHKSYAPPQTGYDDIVFHAHDSAISVVVAENRLYVELEGRPLTTLHLNGMALTEKQADDILKKRNWAIIREDTDEITRVVEDVLRTISQTSQGYSYNPPQYLAKILGINPLDFVVPEDFRIDGESTYQGDAITLALLKILGYYKVEHDIGILGELIPSVTRKRIDEAALRLEDLYEKLSPKAEATKSTPDARFVPEAETAKPDSPENAAPKTNVANLFAQMREIKQETYKAKTVEESIEMLLKPESERGPYFFQNFRFPLRLVGCVIYDKFGETAARKFFEKFFVDDHKREKREAGNLGDRTRMLESINLRESPKTTVQKEVEDAFGFVFEYGQIDKKLTDKITRRIVKENLQNMRLYTGCLHFYEDLLLIEDKNVLGELAKIEVLDEKKDGGKAKRHYLLGGKEISIDEKGKFYTGRRAVVDALEELRKKGDHRKIGFIDVGQNADGKKINFNRVFLIARYGVVTDHTWLNDKELEVLHSLEDTVSTEFDFSCEQCEGEYYEIFYEGKRKGDIRLPDNFDTKTFGRMNIFQALNVGQETMNEAQLFMEIYKMLPKSRRLGDDEIMTEIGKQSEDAMKPESAQRGGYKMSPETAEKAGLAGVEFRKIPGRKYKILRKLKTSNVYETVGELDSDLDIEGIMSIPLHQIGEPVFTQRERDEALRINRMKFSGIDYVENGSMHILRRQGLDELLEEFYQMMGKSGEDLDIKLVRVTNRANQDYFQALIERFVDDLKLSDYEVDELVEKRERSGATITNDDHRRMVLQAQYLAKRGFLDHLLSPLAGMTADRAIKQHEKLVYEFYREVLIANNVPKGVLDFIDKRATSLATIEQPKTREERELPKLIKSAIITGDGMLEHNPQYARIAEILTDMIIPPVERGKELEDMRKRYSLEFMIELARFIDEMPDEGEDIFADAFYTHFRTSKKDIVSRLKKLANEEKLIEDAGLGLYLIENAKGGYELMPGEFRNYVKAMARLPEGLRERALMNITSWGTNNPARKEITGIVTGVLGRPLLEEISHEVSLESAWKGAFFASHDEVADESPGLKESLDRMYDDAVSRIRKIQDKYGIKKDMGITDGDIADLFGDGSDTI